MGYEWAEPYPELYRLCTLFNWHRLKDPQSYSYTPLAAYLQTGPQCGLVALAIALKRPHADFIDNELLQEAIRRNYTYNGEIFSAQDLVQLARNYYPRAFLYTGDLDTRHVKDCLLNRALILVPYDTDYDNHPGYANGHKAHWAVLCGGLETRLNGDFYVFARHGKLRNVAIWNLQDLALSNSQLDQVERNDCKLPPGGICGEYGLKNKAVILPY